jgi:hypothetical protein
MEALMFSEFYKGKFEDIGYELYFVRDAESKAMYIGISRNSIWHRWFGGGASHMDINASEKLSGASYIGQVIERRFPSSWDWTIELWTKEDCLRALVVELEGKNTNRINIETLEPYMISKFEPLYNVMHGGGSHEDPLTTKKLDEAYKKLFR